MPAITVVLDKSKTVTLKYTKVALPTIYGFVYDTAGNPLGVQDITLLLDGVVTSAWRGGNEFQIMNISRGDHTLVVRKPRYEDWSWSGNVEGDVSLDIRLTPTQLDHTLTVNAQANGTSASVRVAIDSRDFPTPGSIALAEGTYTLTAPDSITVNGVEYKYSTYEEI